MKQLEEQFTGKGEVRGFVFTQIKKNDHAFIYEVNDDGRIRYEVFERKINKKWDCESYPKSKSFGRWAWSCMTIEKANDKFEDITIRKESNNG